MGIRSLDPSEAWAPAADKRKRKRSIGTIVNERTGEGFDFYESPPPVESFDAHIDEWRRQRRMKRRKQREEGRRRYNERQAKRRREHRYQHEKAMGMHAAPKKRRRGRRGYGYPVQGVRQFTGPSRARQLRRRFGLRRNRMFGISAARRRHARMRF